LRQPLGALRRAPGQRSAGAPRPAAAALRGIRRVDGPLLPRARGRSGLRPGLLAVDEPLRGSLLVAAPQLIDPNIRRPVVLVAEHSDEGAMGVILNRPSGMTVADAAPDLEDYVGGESPIFAGGPVQPTAGVILAEVEEAGDPIFGDVVLVPGLGELSDVAELAGRARVFAGYAGWGPGQLD